MKYYNKMTRQAGMTLIELTVVLLILIGLAGLLVPYVGSFTQTTHDSTNSNNLAQLNNAVNRYVVDKNRLPPHMDMLVNNSAATTVATGPCSGAAQWGVYCGLANTGLFTPVNFAANSIQAKSLAASAINMAVANNPDIESKTFGTSAGMYYMTDAAGTGAMSAFNGTVAFAQIQGVTGVGAGSVEDHLAKALGRDPMVYNSTCYDYIAMGLGDNNELVQSTATSSPVFFPQDGQYGPAQRYAHFMAVIQVDKANTGANAMGQKCSEVTEKAKFLGVVANVPSSESSTLVGVNSSLSAGWNNKAQGGS